MGTLRIILLIIHIISAGLWISEEVIGRIMKPLIDKNKGQAAELTLANATMRLFSTFGPIASMGIFLTGIGLTLNNGWVLFGIGGFTPGWLLIKQVVYVLLIVLVMLGIRPISERLAKSFSEATHNGLMTEEAREILSRMWTLGQLHTLLVFINIILAVWKPSIG